MINCRIKKGAMSKVFIGSLKFIFTVVAFIVALVVIILAIYFMGYALVHFIGFTPAWEVDTDFDYYMEVGVIPFVFMAFAFAFFIIYQGEMKGKKYYGFDWLIECEGDRP